MSDFDIAEVRRLVHSGMVVPLMEIGPAWRRVTYEYGREVQFLNRLAGRVRGSVIKGFTTSARMRLLRVLGSIREDTAPPRLLTLTYPAEWSHNPAHWARNLDQFVQRVRRRWPSAVLVWRREFQRRGAPHYHIAIWNTPTMSARWLSRSWFEVVGSGDDRHLAAGTKLEFPRSRNAWVSYLAKELGKTHQSTCARLYRGGVGRSWGIIGRRHWARMVSFSVIRLTAEEWVEWQSRITAAVSVAVGGQWNECYLWTCRRIPGIP